MVAITMRAIINYHHQELIPMAAFGDESCLWKKYDADWFEGELGIDGGPFSLVPDQNKAWLPPETEPVLERRYAVFHDRRRPNRIRWKSSSPIISMRYMPRA